MPRRWQTHWVPNSRCCCSCWWRLKLKQRHAALTDVVTTWIFDKLVIKEWKIFSLTELLLYTADGVPAHVSAWLWWWDVVTASVEWRLRPALLLCQGYMCWRSVAAQSTPAPGLWTSWTVTRQQSPAGQPWPASTPPTTINWTWPGVSDVMKARSDKYQIISNLNWLRTKTFTNFLSRFFAPLFVAKIRTLNPNE